MAAGSYIKAKQTMTISDAIISGDTADIYFHRTREILRREGIDPVVVMEIFPNRDGILCGINEALQLLDAVLPATAEVWHLPEGVAMEAKQVALRIRAPYSTFGLYETALLGILASQSGWATAAHAIVQTAAPTPVISFGARHIHPNVAAQMEYAAIVGGCATSATPAGARLAGKQPSGTMPHALILILGDTVRAAQAFDKWMPPEVNRTALVDTFRDEAEETLRVASALGDRLWGVRLDTPSERGRVTPELVKETRARLDQAGFPRVKIFVSGGVDAERIALFKNVGAPVDGFGIGSAISGAPPIDFTGDLKEIDGKPIAKRGRIPGITPNPRLQAWSRRVE
ncbi:nicotinate phosphoribosyltransferase [Anaerolineae bacterium]|nr:nicotinate phosphoribosyltransferase [Anaerolineae bacterium]